MRPLKELIADVKRGIIEIRTYNQFQILCAEVWPHLERLKELEDKLSKEQSK